MPSDLLRSMRRVAVIGSGGSGKSTLARSLGQATGLPVIHLDREHWQPGWVEPTREQWHQTHAALIEKSAWIIDGNYGGEMQPRFAACDTVIFLDYSRWTCLVRVLKRWWMYRGGGRPDMAPGCTEKLDFKFLRWVWNYPKRNRPRVLELAQQNARPGFRFIRLTSPKKTQQWLERLQTG